MFRQDFFGRLEPVDFLGGLRPERLRVALPLGVGLMRRDIAKRTALLGSFSGSDCTLLAELSLYGRFAEVDEYLFFRRVHPQAYSFKPSLESDLAFFAPQMGRKPSLLLHMWRHLYEHWRAIRRSPLSLGERFALYGHLVKMAWWKKRSLVSELFAITRAITLRGHQ